MPLAGGGVGGLMPRGLAIAVTVLVASGCSKGKLHGPAGVKAVASCDYTSKTIGTNHSCTEIYDPARIAAHEAFCNKLRGARDHGVFTTGHVVCQTQYEGTFHSQGTP